ncbi:hypothetical protein KC352_g27595, partial [Hortaea werneckii]
MVCASAGTGCREGNDDENPKTNQMKFSTALVTLAAVASQAAAVNPTAAEGTEDLAAFQQG